MRPCKSCQGVDPSCLLHSPMLPCSDYGTPLRAHRFLSTWWCFDRILQHHGAPSCHSSHLHRWRLNAKKLFAFIRLLYWPWRRLHPIVLTWHHVTFWPLSQFESLFYLSILSKMLDLDCEHCPQKNHRRYPRLWMTHHHQPVALAPSFVRSPSLKSTACFDSCLPQLHPSMHRPYYRQIRFLIYQLIHRGWNKPYSLDLPIYHVPGVKQHHQISSSTTAAKQQN